MWNHEEGGHHGKFETEEEKKCSSRDKKTDTPTRLGNQKEKKAGWPPFHQQESLHDGGHPGANNTQGALTDNSRKAKVLFKLGQIYSSARYLAEHIRGEPLILINVYSYFPMPPFFKKRGHTTFLFFFYRTKSSNDETRVYGSDEQIVFFFYIPRRLFALTSTQKI